MDEAGRGIHAEQRVQALAEAEPRRGLEAASQLLDPVPPHQVELDEGAVLVEDQQLDPVERVASLGLVQPSVAGGAGSLTSVRRTLAHLLAVDFV
jgi:hypothetical protein